MIRWGVLSTARIGEQQLIPAIREAQNAELTAVASRDKGTAAAFAGEHHIPKVYGSYAELLQDPDIQAVYIPLPNHLHAQWSIEAAKFGKHVLCEKPAALNATETREIAQASEKYKTLWMEAFMYQFHPQWDRVNAVLAAGEIGDIRLINASFSFPFNRVGNFRLNAAMGGGALYDVGCYAIHVCRTMAGDVLPDTIHAVAQLGQGGIDTTTSAVLHFPTGIQAHFDCSFEIADRQFVEIVGTEGRILVPMAFRPDKGVPTIIVENGSGRSVEEIPQRNAYTLQVEHFSTCVEQGSELRNTPQQSIRNMQIIDAILADIHR